ncbi:Scr1 family TA system antitoxin-like transcriptional regulator [Streptomyces sp. NPDC087532]|uniref:Scr1 family TA system antitoxin-like transcriptional regulator n=1 Tax=Streptomyces sp. NPDC087532 TaxID=3365795 RepID=UPI0038295F7D
MLETSVLDHPVGGPAVFAAQIEHLLHTANQGLIRVRVVPMDAQVYAPAINIAELVLPNGLRIYATTDGGVLYRGGMDENTRMAEFLQRAADASLPETESRALLEHVRDAAATGKPLLRL